MKKKYVKPELFFESFEMNTAIASCAVKGNMQQDQCGYDDKELGFVIFVDGASYCQYAPPSGNQLCYDIPIPDNKIFYS